MTVGAFTTAQMYQLTASEVYNWEGIAFPDAQETLRKHENTVHDALSIHDIYILVVTAGAGLCP